MRKLNLRSLKIIRTALLSSLVSFSACAHSPEVIHRAPPRDPIILSTDDYLEFKNRISRPPTADSETQRSDEAELFTLQNSRKTSDCKRANDEVHPSLKIFFGMPYGTLSDSEVEAIQPLFQTVGAETYYFSERMKKDFPRQRPFQYLDGIKPCVPKEESLAYPSGHALVAKITALVLADLFPLRKTEFTQRSWQIGNDRVLAGVHHPSDIKAGYRLAELIYDKLKTSKQYQEEFRKTRDRLLSSH